jgi:hypothetical protein
MNSSLVKASFVTGLLIFIVSAIPIIFDNEVGFTWLVVYYLPGIIFPMVLIKYSKKSYDEDSVKISPVRAVMFVVVSFAIHLVNCRIALNFITKTTGFYFAIPGTTGSVCLFILYFLLINNKFIFSKSLLYFVALGIVSAIFPVIAFLVKTEFSSIYYANTLHFCFVLLMIPTWMTLFSWSLVKCSRSGEA